MGVFTLLYTIRDGKGQQSTTEMNVPDSFALADVILFARGAAGFIDDMIGGQLVRIGIAVNLDLPPGIKVTPQSTSDVEEGARFQFRTAGGFGTSMRIPTFQEANLVPGTTQVDLTDPNVAPFVTMMESGIDVDLTAGVRLITPSDKREDDIVTLDSAREQFLSSR